MEEYKVAIIGCGIVGLTTALEVQDKFPKYEIIIFADNFNEKTTSYGAAGIFRPGTSFCGPNDAITKQWIDDSYKVYSELLQDRIPGIHVVSGFNLSNISFDLTRNALIEHLLPVYRTLNDKELENIWGKRYKYGTFSKTLVIENFEFLPWAMKRFTEKGGKIIEKHINNFKELENKFDLVFNCSGFGAKYLCNDRKMVPMRGQVIKVSAPWLQHFYYLDYDVYIIPHSNGSVTLGGCRQYDSYSLEINQHDTAKILEACYEVVPQLRQAPIITEWCGLRPHRSEVRVEYQKLGQLHVIHNYGHGGYGVTTAPGTAKQAVKILQSLLENCHSKKRPRRSKL